MLLLVSPCKEDHALFRRFFRSDWTIHDACTCPEALALLARKSFPVVISERDLPDGNWMDVHRGLALLPKPPSLIVTSRLADHSLWAEVLNVGGYDVLAKPLNEAEAVRVVQSAWMHWKARWERTIQKVDVKAAKAAVGCSF